MRAILITETDYIKLNRLKEKEIAEAYNHFRNKKKTHLKEPGLKEFFEKCSDDFNQILFTIPFKCYFSIYLYLFLKKRADKFDIDKDKYQFVFSKPLEVNVSEIARIARVPLNTVKTAFHELVKQEFLIYTDELSLGNKNKAKSSILVNDFFLIGFDSATMTTCFFNKQMKFAAIN